MIGVRRKFLALTKIVHFEGESRFKRNIILVARANILAQVLVFASSPLLTRLYSPSDFGAFAIFSSILGLCLSFSVWRFDWSIPNTKSRVQAFSLVVVGLIFLKTFSVVFIAFLVFFEKITLEVQAFQVLGVLALLLPIALFGNGAQQLMHAWYIRETDLAVVSKSRIYQSIASTITTILGGLTHLGALGLILGNIAMAWVGLGTLTRHAGIRAHIRRLSYVRVYVGLRRFWREATASTLVSIVNTASLTAVPLLLAQHYSATEVGWYALMYRIAFAPVDLFTTAISQSFWAEAATLIKINRSALRDLYIKSTWRLMILSVPVSLVALCGPLYVEFIFGEEWHRAGYVLVALVPLLIGHITIPTLSHLVVHRRQHWQLIWDISRLAFLVLAITGCSSLNMSVEIAVLAASIVMFCMYLVLFWLNFICLRGK
ncbi:MAG: oligosaccharide flippase family protein [Roseiflexaceae bacterium]|nr:oligosaccharide flippase family protein [Roseiflexaceae bacterium]